MKNECGGRRLKKGEKWIEGRLRKEGERKKDSKTLEGGRKWMKSGVCV